LFQVVRSSEELLTGRLSRRGFSSEDCRELLKSSNGNVILLKKYSCRNSNLKGFAGAKNS